MIHVPEIIVSSHYRRKVCGQSTELSTACRQLMPDALLYVTMLRHLPAEKITCISMNPMIDIYLTCINIYLYEM